VAMLQQFRGLESRYSHSTRT